MRKIELLAPAKSAQIGIEAINHGADAVYIGAPQFGARSAAGNTIEEIERLTTHAHLYGAQVYVAMNTLLKDEELATAERLTHQIYEAGADALIVQDMGLLQLDLPPIALHASTQTDNRTPEKVAFLQQMGFSQVVLARELSLSQIAKIATATTVPLEAFIHGALCVSYSGQCYISQQMSGRSANRGECAQYCRLPYDLVDSNGKIIAHNKHLLSLKDLNLTQRLEMMLDAGVSSLKIEGRLKDMAYVKNVTAHYRKELDQILDRRTEFQTASVGRCSYTFEPDPKQSFNRGFTHYFIDGRNDQTPIISPLTPKSVGTPIGVVKRVDQKSITLTGDTPLNNGDGVAYYNNKSEFEGFRINRVEGNTLYPATPVPHQLKVGTELFRNYNHAFETLLNKPSATRLIAVDMTLSDTPMGYQLTLCDECGTTITTQCDVPSKEPANTPQEQNQQRQLSRLGGTPYTAREVALAVSGSPFIPASLLSQLRQEGVELLTQKRIESYTPPKRLYLNKSGANFPSTQLTYLGNVANRQARLLYQQQGVEGEIAPAYEIAQPTGVHPVMFTKHCLRHHFGACPKVDKVAPKWQEPLLLVHKEMRLQLHFDCKRCEMTISKV